MRILAIADVVPLRDRSAGWSRFYHILRILSRIHEVHLHPVDLDWQLRYHGEEDTKRYIHELESLGVRVTTGKRTDLLTIIRSQSVDLAFFEHYGTVRGIVDYIRFWQPDARVVIDTIDVAYQRLYAKAKLTGNQEDLLLAQTVKVAELSAYARSDVVIGISGVEAALLKQANPGLRIEVIPLIFTAQPLERKRHDVTHELVYVAHFDHAANVDGIVHFYLHVLPLIRQEVPDIRLRIVGHSPPAEVQALSGPNVEVLGFVPDIGEIYRSSDVAIAPMRYGGGLKGKIAEAMSWGLPVVTNSACLEGFSLVPGEDVLVGNDPKEFALAVVQVLRDRILYDRMRENGWRYVKTHFSEEIVATMLHDLIERSKQHPAKRLPVSKRVGWKLMLLLEKYVFWRFRSGALEVSR